MFGRHTENLTLALLGALAVVGGLWWVATTIIGWIQ